MARRTSTDRKPVLRALGDFAATVAHELRTPAFNIASAAQLLRFRSHEDPVIEKNVGRILRDADRLNRLVTALQEFGRPEPVRLAPGDPDDVWDRVIEHHQGTLESRSLTLRRTRAAGHVRIPIDRDQLGRAFEAVLVNAAEAAPPRGEITLASEVDQAGVWECVLANGGEQLPAEAAARAFDLFFTTKPDSAGVGLAICRRIIAEHDGTIALESGETTRVTIALPAG